ncbi:hypothetical protein BU24DRAFT_181346 [Aaosphaeria arxii CBS 175.79]|uniref:Uncharacterized protein n=1 Tax=Aaosphaeria arxii CBS 175.79 TaxID=1450172 RepID=A0A6A5XS08_9PLEO|nr:uncharacterized protein BU24DRAFT_181346 [Aaosphaeria arxii CBS 175.79]KAF2015597.1 hypothetical protein BU24DRAFT_181346 [Aaosphaeria arxii CBS 175.79]
MDTNTVSADLPATFNELKARQRREIEQLASKHSAEVLDLHSKHRKESVAFTNKKAAEAAFPHKAALESAKGPSAATIRINSSPKKPIQFTSTELKFEVPVTTRDKFAKGRDVYVPEGTGIIDLLSDDDDGILEITTSSASGAVISPGSTLGSVEFLSQIATAIKEIPSTTNEVDSPPARTPCTPSSTGRADNKVSVPTPSTPPKPRSPGKKVITPDRRTQIPHNEFRSYQFDRSNIVKNPTQYSYGLRLALEQPAQVAQMFKESPVGEEHFQQGPNVKQTVTQKIQGTKGFSASRTLKENPQKRQSRRVAPMTPPPALSLGGYPLTPPTSGSGAASFTPGIKTSTSSITSRAQKSAFISPTQVSPTASKGNKRKTIGLSDSEVESSKLSNSKLSPKSPRGKPTVQV